MMYSIKGVKGLTMDTVVKYHLRNFRRCPSFATTRSRPASCAVSAPCKRHNMSLNLLRGSGIVSRAVPVETCYRHVWKDIFKIILMIDADPDCRWRPIHCLPSISLRYPPL